MCTAQELPTNEATGKVNYSDIVDAPGISKKLLFDRAKKWLASKHSPANPYAINYENEQEGSIIGTGSFSLPSERRRYLVQFAIRILIKDGKFKYELTDLMMQYRSAAGSSGGGFAFYSGSSYRDAETIEYTIETFYPSRVKSRKPVIKWFDEINRESFELIDRQMKANANSLKQAVAAKEEW